MNALGEIFKISKGKKAIESSFETTLRYIQIGDLRNDDVMKYTTQSSTNVLCTKDDILIAWDGANAGTVGYNLEGVVGSTLAKLSPKKEGVHINYVGRFLQSKFEYLRENCTGATIPHLSRPVLENLQIPLPPLEQQKKIAAILDAADAYRQKTKSLIAKYDELTQSLFLDMFGDPVKNEKGWEKKTIEKLVKENKSSIKRGPFGGALKKEIFVEEGYLVYEQFHALNNDFSMARYFIDESKFQELKGFEVKPKDIIISCSGVYLGKLAIIPENARKGIINQALLKITLNEEKMKNNFFVFLFSHKNFREKYFDANRGAGIPNFPPMNEFKKFPFITPPISLQNQFAERVQVIETQKTQAQASLVKAEELFNSLSQRAFKGELM